MSGEQYTQIKRPVGRLTEKVLGWFSWVFLLILTIVTMFIALVSFSNDTSIANLESSLNNNELVQQILGNNDLSTTQFVIWLQNGVWAIIVYFIICLLISFLALISMNIRILSGFLFLLAAVVTIPLVLLVVTLIIPILFFIIAIMMFARKNRVETVPAYYNDGYGQPYYDDYEYYDNRDHRLILIVTIMKRGTITVITMIMNNLVIIKNIEIHVENVEKNVNVEKLMKQSNTMNRNNMMVMLMMSQRVIIMMRKIINTHNFQSVL